MKSSTALVLGVPLAVASASFVLSSYGLTLAITIGTNALVCIGLVLMAGQAGIASFGQAAFVGVGAYMTALVTTFLFMSPWLSLIVSLCSSSLIALLIGWITVRLSGHYLVLGTLGWGIGFYYVLANIPGLGGYDGISGLPQLFYPNGVDERLPFNILVWTLIALAMLLAVNILDSAPGRAIRVVRVKAMAESFGIDTAHYKLILFIFAAATAGVSGWLQAHLLRFVNPTPFNLNASVEYLFMSIIGGVPHVLGAIAGSTFVVLMKSLLQSRFADFLSASGNYENVAFGAIVLLLLHFAPNGMMGLLPRTLQIRSQLKAGAAEALPVSDKPPRGCEILHAEAVSKNFGGVQALSGVSIAVSAGEIVALVGPNGAGKSTLFDLLSGLAPVSSGTVRLRGERIDGRSARAVVRRGLARTFQHALMNEEMTVLENVAIGGHFRVRTGIVSAALRWDRRRESALLAEATRLLEMFGLQEASDEPAGSLALGQQRIIEVARALMADPAIILLDEPAAGLRYLEKQALARAVKAMHANGIAVLLVEHDLEFVRDVAQRVVVLDFGVKIAEGPVEAVMNCPRVIEAYLGRPRAAA